MIKLFGIPPRRRRLRTHTLRSKHRCASPRTGVLDEDLKEGMDDDEKVDDDEREDEFDREKG